MSFLSAPCLVWLLFLIPFPLWFPSQLVRPLRTWCLKHPLRFEASLPFFLYCHQEIKKKKKKERSPSLVLNWRGLSTCAPTHGAITDGRSTAALAPGTPPHLSSGIPWAGLSLEAGSCLSKKILAVFHSCLGSLRLVTCVPPTPHPFCSLLVLTDLLHKLSGPRMPRAPREATRSLSGCLAGSECAA